MIKMKNLRFKKFAFLVAIGICVLFGAANAAVTVADVGTCSLSDVSFVVAGGYAFLAAPVITEFDFETLTAVSVQEFTELRAKYGKLYVINIKIDETESYQYILRRPTRQHLEMIESYKNDLSGANNIIIKNLVVAGDREALNDGIVYAAFGVEAGKIVGQAQSFLYKA